MGAGKLDISLVGHDRTETLEPPPQYAEELREMVQRKFELYPDSYEMYDKLGAVTDTDDLRRAMQTGTIHVKELPAFQRIRELLSAVTDLQQARDQAIAEREQLRADLKSLEGRHDKHGERIKKTEMDIQTHDGRISVTEQRIDRLVERVDGHDDEFERFKVIHGDGTRVGETTQHALDALRAEVAQDIQLELERAMSGRWLENMRLKIIESIKVEMNRLSREAKAQMQVVMQADAERAKEVALLKGTTELQGEEVSVLREEMDVTRRDLGQLDKHIQDKMTYDVVILKRDVGRLQDMGVNWSKKIETMLETVGQLSDHTDFKPPRPFCQRWSSAAKGPDIQLNADLSCATGRAEMARHGLTMEETGLVWGDAPLRVFDGKGRYFQIVVDEIYSGPGQHAGLMIGVSFTAPDRIRNCRFDGWEVGGSGRLTRHRLHGADGQLLSADMKRIKDSPWNSGKLAATDRVGLLVAEVDGSLCVFVNDKLIVRHQTKISPDDEVYPLIRVAGSAKTLRYDKGGEPPPDACRVDTVIPALGTEE
mmetsp:Transcript_48294/g.105116  ORF Transcript_48294/g.105116 Transcript_48294/m.105116 type:complete len:538 (+) Transcript_48294:46-1659(+)